MTRRNPRAAYATIVLAALTLASCSSDDGDATAATKPSAATTTVAGEGAPDDDGGEGRRPTTTARTGGRSSDPDALPPFEPAPIAWERFSDDVDVATIEVPVDYSDPDGPRFELFLARATALDPDRRIGTLLVNPGGPGFPGSDFAIFAPQIFDRALLERFDIIGWDPRGTGESDPPIDCIDDYDPFFTAIDSTPADNVERQALVEVAREFAELCVENNREIIEHVGTNNSARDIDTIRRAIGEDQISYFGFSYGSELGGTWATLFPETVRAAVLDGASDPEADALDSSLQQLAGFNASLESFLERCSDDDDCAFHSDGEARAAFVALMDELDADPVPGDDGRPPVNRDVALTAVIQAMYSDLYWAALEESLAAAEQGDGSGLLALHDSYYQRAADGTYGNELEAFQVITCADTPERPTVAETDAEAQLFTEVAPLLAPEGSAGGYFCNFFPPSADPRITITGAGAGPIVVIGTTGDPATPFESTARMAETLEDGRLVIVEADQHTGYGVNRCVVDLVNDYLIDLEPPDDGTECR